MPATIFDMGTVKRHLDRWRLSRRKFWQGLAPPCGHADCRLTPSLWRRLRGRPPTVMIQGLRYCREECVERALAETLRRVRSNAQRPVATHRVPLGLLLLSRQQLTAGQLRAALEAQRTAGRGRIGEWLQTLGFASEQHITAALARQWSRPVLRPNFQNTSANRTPQIPLTLLDSFVMIPVDYVATTATLHIAFGEGIDYSVLYAIEQMLECRTESCMAVPSFVRQSLRTLSEHRGESEIVFDRVADGAEFLRIIRSYSARLDASEIRLAACGPHLWARLLRTSRPPLDLLLRSFWDASIPAPFPVTSARLSSV